MTCPWAVVPKRGWRHRRTSGRGVALCRLAARRRGRAALLVHARGPHKVLLVCAGARFALDVDRSVQAEEMDGWGDWGGQENNSDDAAWVEAVRRVVQRFEAEAKRAGLLGGAPKKTRGFRGGNAAAAGRRSAEIRAAASAAMAEGSAAGAGGNAAGADPEPGNVAVGDAAGRRAGVPEAFEAVGASGVSGTPAVMEAAPSRRRSARRNTRSEPNVQWEMDVEREDGGEADVETPAVVEAVPDRRRSARLQVQTARSVEQQHGTDVAMSSCGPDVEEDRPEQVRPRGRSSATAGRTRGRGRGRSGGQQAVRRSSGERAASSRTDVQAGGTRKQAGETAARPAQESVASGGEPAWKRFTPEVIDHEKCLARTFAGGRGGQCRNARLSGTV